MVQAITEKDHFRHSAPSGLASWQESWMVSWYDPKTRTGGYHHIDFQPNRRRACVQSWYAERGVVVSRYQSMNVPMADYDPDAFDLGPLSMRSKGPHKGFVLNMDHIDPQSGLRHPLVQLDFAPFTEPLLLTKEKRNVGPSEYAADIAGHFELLGRFVAKTPAGGGASGYAFMDHSWGPRDWGSISSTARWGHFIFDENLFAVVYSVGQDVKRFDYGYIFNNGRHEQINSVWTRVGIAHDGHTAETAEIRFWTAQGSGYRIVGTTDVSSVNTQDGGHFWTPSYGTYELGSRLCGGLLEIGERRRPSAEQLEWLTAHDPGPAAGA
jgi:hypothetical protein